MTSAPALTIGETIARMSGASFVMLSVLLLAIQLALILAPLKWRQLRQLRRSEDRFETALVESQSAEEISATLEHHGTAPGARVIRALMEHHRRHPSAGYEELLGEARRLINLEQARAERLLPTLATIAGTAPLMGLFGTVWGIIEAFLTLSAERSSELTVIAPAMSGALLTTAFGLLAAMPASVSYNYASNWVNGFLDGLDAIAQIWSGRISGR